MERRKWLIGACLHIDPSVDLASRAFCHLPGNVYNFNPIQMSTLLIIMLEHLQHTQIVVHLTQLERAAPDRSLSELLITELIQISGYNRRPASTQKRQK
ncbi:hypothetical protein D1872_291740 [compost metagenome]